MPIPARGSGRAAAPRIGLALGSGGARGLAHIPVLEVLDELGVRPVVIAGTSIGALIGAGYATGVSGAEIRDYVTGLFRKRSDVVARLWQLRPKSMRDLLPQGGLAISQFDAERVVEAFAPPWLPRDFAELVIPLKVVATDFYAHREVHFSEGPLRPAVAASIAIPFLFRPVLIEGRALMDGGIFNPLPFDLVAGDCDIVVAVDVIGGPSGSKGGRPGPTEAVFGATQLLMRAILTQKLRTLRPPDILVRPSIDSFRVLEFAKAGAIIRSAAATKDEVRAALGRLIEAHAGRA